MLSFLLLLQPFLPLSLSLDGRGQNPLLLLQLLKVFLQLLLGKPVCPVFLEIDAVLFSNYQQLIVPRVQSLELLILLVSQSRSFVVIFV